ncbi:MAG: NAD(P)H-hydrate dehydratase [Roseburia sp.]|nr:NAD(P)H-hydrate dehydratase [Roseburia sp.]
MEYILRAAEMKKCDETATKTYGIASLVLMERAALETARVIVNRYGRDISVCIMAGSGNNGGDGIAIARILQEEGIHTQINLVGEESRLTAETAAQLETAGRLHIPVSREPCPADCDVIVDALFGIGLTRAVEGRFRQAIEAVNASRARVVSVDIPSGINSDNGSVMGCAVKADITVTYAYRKLGMLLYPGASYAGETMCVPIGIPREIVECGHMGVFTYTRPEEELRLPDRSPAGNKGTFGKALLIAGAATMGGACILSALSAYRIGAGMVRVFTAQENRESLLVKLPEAIIDTYRDDGLDGLSETEAAALSAAMEWADVIAIGPGLSVSDKARSILTAVLSAGEKPLVADADALNLLSRNRELLSGLSFDGGGARRDIVITPHLGELSRLAECPVERLREELIASCETFTRQYDVTLVCKDARTVVAKKGRAVYVNSCGNDGMATAGSGDVLTGMIAGLLAQGQTGYDAAVTGVCAHGLAGDIAKEAAASYYIMAQDIIRSLRYLKRGMDKNG